MRYLKTFEENWFKDFFKSPISLDEDSILELISQSKG